MSRTSAPGLPSRKQILDFIATSDQPAGKREIARAFGLHGADKQALKTLLTDMADEGLIDSSPGRAFHQAGGVPKVTVLRITDVDEDGQAWAVPERWEASAPEPRLRVREKSRRGALGIGDRILARTEEAGKGWIAHPLKQLLKGSELIMGVLHEGEAPAKAGGGRLWLKALDKKSRYDLPVADAGGAGAGDLVLAEKTGRPPRITARVTEKLGDPFEPRSFSLIAIHKLGIPHEFDAETLAEAKRVAGLALGEREDLRHLPIVAIDPADARDHDDAVWASPRDDGGWDAIVAIADVSFYVRPGSALDREARRRGNSVYFPDRVVPMLPEILSADVCSLKAGEDRAALACHMTIDAGGTIKSWRFSRAVVRLVANIAYEDAQAAIDAASDTNQDAHFSENNKTTHLPELVEGLSSSLSSGEPKRRKGFDKLSQVGLRFDRELIETTLTPLWACWRALYAAREKREPLDLDLPERRVELDERGRILSVAPRERLDAHKLIEDYMIAANVAAAKALEAKKAPVMYRVHEPPSRVKLVALKEYLKTFGVEFALGQVVRPATFNRVLALVGEADHKPQVMEQVLRSQTQAYYAPLNQGHFGLSLGSYAHFTSPIRRYADLLVHRALVSAYGLGEGGLAPDEAATMERIGESISQLERRAMEAERDTVDRYVAAYLSERVGEVIDVRITGVQNFGFFATVEGLGGDGLVSVRDLGGEYFRYDEVTHSLTGEDSGESYAIGQRLKLRLAEASPISGALRFELPEGKGAAPGSLRRRPRAGDRRAPSRPKPSKRRA